MNLNHHPNYNHIIHDSSSSSLGFLSPPKPPNNLHPSHPSFPIIAVAIIGIFATIFLLVFYYIFVIKCCLNWHRIDILRRFSLSRSRNHHHHHHQYPLHHHHHLPPPEPQGLHESVIRSIPIFHFQKQKDSGECAVCLAEFQHQEKLRIIPKCAHVFHIDCIDVWLQNNPNCPLCRNSISVSLETHFPAPETNLSPPQTLGFAGGDDQDYVVIELEPEGGREDDGGGQNSGEPVANPNSPAKKRMRKKNGFVSSMGDECIDVHRKGDDLFSIQPIRRSFSMDSASDRQLYLAVQEVIQRNADATDGGGSGGGGGGGGGRLRRGLFSFGHARSAILPLHVKP